MKNRFILLWTIILALTLLTGCDKDPRDRQVYEKDFSTRYHETFPACDCFLDPNFKNGGLGRYGDGSLYKSGRKIGNNNDAEAFFNRWLFVIQTEYFDVDKIKEVTRIECQSIGYGFYNCFVFNEFYVTISDDGDIYKTVCME